MREIGSELREIGSESIWSWPKFRSYPPCPFCHSSTLSTLPTATLSTLPTATLPHCHPIHCHATLPPYPLSCHTIHPIHCHATLPPHPLPCHRYWVFTTVPGITGVALCGTMLLIYAACPKMVRRANFEVFWWVELYINHVFLRGFLC
jgi:hypothetical protein